MNAGRDLSGFTTHPASIVAGAALEGSYSVAGHDGDTVRLLSTTAHLGKDTELALENWSGLTNLTPQQAYPSVIKAIGICKAASADVNFELGAFRDVRVRPGEDPVDAVLVHKCITAACSEMIAGHLNSRMVVDVLQGGAGTSLHMNANHVLGWRATELLLQELGRESELASVDCLIHANDLINDGQSTNDVIPTAARIGTLLEHRAMMAALRSLEDALRARAAEQDFINTPLVGRTHLQDAVPVTMAQVFETYATTFRAARRFIDTASDLLKECTLGATAIGTGITSRPGYRERITERVNAYLAEGEAGFELRAPTDYGKTTSSLFEVNAYSKTLAAYADEITKFANDIRSYASGPRAGLGELSLPERQPGSSIMPGKVNPVMMEVLNQIATIIKGNDLTIGMNAAAGQFQLNVMAPTVIWKLSESMSLLQRGVERAVELCVSDIILNVERARENANHSIIGVTALKPVVGYDRAAAIAKQAIRTGDSLSSVLGDGAFLSTIRLNAGDVQPDAVANGALLELALPPRLPVDDSAVV